MSSLSQSLLPQVKEILGTHIDVGNSASNLILRLAFLFGLSIHEVICKPPNEKLQIISHSNNDSLSNSIFF